MVAPASAPIATASGTGNGEAQIIVDIANNQALLDAGSVEGEVNATALNAHAVGGDALATIPYVPGQGTDPDFLTSVGIYADDRLVAFAASVNRPVRLPSGFTTRKWAIDVQGRTQVAQISMATSIADLQRVG